MEAWAALTGRGWRGRALGVVPAGVVDRLSELQAKVGRATVAAREVPQLRGQVQRLTSSLERARRERKQLQQELERARVKAARVDRADEVVKGLESLLARPDITHQAVEALWRRLGGE